ncbi:transposable element Tcb1 transposase [Trichonephila clavipes]|nr:transposable element Tcb1 transposase [Trichonephila clavipes]
MAKNQSVRRHLDAFTRGRIIGKLEEGRSVTSVAAEFGIAHSIVSRLWRQFKITGTAIRGFSSGHSRGTTPADDRYIVLQARRNRWQTAGEIARHTTQSTGRPISLLTVARRLHGGGLFARRPVRCVPLTPAHRRRHSLWCREHRNWRDNEWGRVLFTDESRFSLSSDSHRILIWREWGSRNHPSNIIERDRSIRECYGRRCVSIKGCNNCIPVSLVVYFDFNLRCLLKPIPPIGEDLVILIHSQVTRMKFELAALSELTHHAKGRTLNLDRFNVHQPLFTDDLHWL